MNNQIKLPVIVWWVVWIAMLSGIPMFYIFLGGKGPTSAVETPMWFVGAAPLLISVVIRWFILPRMQNGAAALPLFIIGIATAEMVCFLGLFIFPAHKQELAILSGLGILQFAPYFAGRYS